MTEQNQELLLAISDMLDRKLDEKLDEKLDQKFETELRPIKDDICELKTDVKELRSDVTELQSNMTVVQDDVKELRSDVTELQSDMTKLQENVHGIHLYLENEVDYKISLLAENYVPAAKRFEQSASRIDAVEEDVGILKTVVAQHSKVLQQLA